MDKQQEKQFNVFAYGLPLICLFLAWRQYAKYGWHGGAIGFTVAAVIVFVMAFCARPQLRIVFKYWMKGAQMIGAVFTTVILTAIFFAVFTPAGIILRIMGKDFLRLRSRGKMDSYWIKREANLTEYTQQF